MSRLVWIPLVWMLGGCAYAFFSAPNPVPDRSRPVALIETRGGVELGATTEYGVLFLGRTATEGPCRVHYFLGPTPVVDDGTIESTGSSYYKAETDLKNQAIRVLEREVEPGDSLVAMYMAGFDVQTVGVSLAQDPEVDGYVLSWPGASLPPGAAILLESPDDDYRFVGLVSGEAELRTDGNSKRFVVFSGPDYLRDMLLVPERYPTEETILHRPDDITVIKR